MDQRTMVTIALIVVVIAVVGFLGWLHSRQNRSRMLRRRFGPEYDRVVHSEGDLRRAEGVLEFRAKRREKLPIRPLDRTQRTVFNDRWLAVQSRFVDDPGGAVADADHLLGEVMQVRGYPMTNFEQQAADISVDYPRVVENYRAAHNIAVQSRNGQSNTEDLRKAMVHYRSLFDELTED